MRRCKLVMMMAFAMASGTAMGDITMNVHNDIGDPDLWLYMNYDPNGTDGVKNMPNKKYVQPWKGKTAPFEPYTFSFKHIRSGNLTFGLMGKVSEQWLSEGTAVGMLSDAYFGLVEFTYLATDEKAYWDVSNVDQTGMMSGMTCKDPRFSKCGYKLTGNALQAGLLKHIPLGKDSPAYKKCGPGDKYRTLYSPTIIPSAYVVAGGSDNVMGKYLSELQKNTVKVELTSDSVLAGGVSANFSGTFLTAPAKVDGVDDVILKLTGDDAKKTNIYLTTTCLNGETIFGGDSSGGLYVSQNGVLIAKNVHMNWIDGSHDPTDKEVSSTIRNLVVAMNLGSIKYTKNAVYKQSDTGTHVPAYTGAYSNRYNQYIVDNSNSYGMPYSDGAHAKVQYYTSGTAVVDLHVLAPDDANTKSYYNTASE